MRRTPRIADYQRYALQHKVYHHAAGGFAAAGQPGLSVLDGWFYAPLSLPVARNRLVCLDLHGIYAYPKYEHLVSSGALQQALDNASQQIERCFVLGGAHNYYHFLLDYLGNLVAVTAGNPGELERCAIIDGLTPEYAQLLEAGLRYLGVAQPRLVALPVDTVACVNCLAPVNHPAAQKLDFLKTFARSLEPRRGPAQLRRIFALRGASAERRTLRNEGAIARHLEKQYGFVTVDGSALSIRDQMRVYADAETVVGAHGAALTNAAFSGGLRSMVELYAGVRQPHFQNICALLGARHEFLEGVPVTDVDSRESFGTMRMDNLDYEIDVPALDRAVTKALG